MKIKHVICIIGVFVLLLAVGCLQRQRGIDEEVIEKESDEPIPLEDNETVLYYLNDDKTKVVEAVISLELDKYTESYTINKLLRLLRVDPDEKGMVASIPPTVNINKVTYNEANLSTVVDFNSNFKNLSNDEKLLLRTSVVLTLTKLSYVTSVKITVDGEPLLDPNNQAIGFLRANDFIIHSEDYLLTPEKYDVTLYFANSAGTALIREKRTVKVGTGKTLPSIILEELKKGPTQEGLLKTMPTGTKVIDVREKNGICYIGLSNDFLQNAPEAAINDELSIYSIVNSLTDLVNINQVKFDIEGNNVKQFKSITGFDKALSRNLDAVEK